jgi:hypothetical protein
MVLITFSSIGFGQNTLGERVNANAMSGTVNTGDRLYTSKPFVKQLEGSPYLVDKWMKSTLKLKSVSKELATDQLKYDVLNNYFDVLIAGEIKSIGGKSVTGFELIDENNNARKFEACRQFKTKTPIVKGYFEILYTGELKLMERAYVFIKPATYNTALMIGEKNDRIIIKKEYYYQDQTGNTFLLKKIKHLKNLGGTNPKTSKTTIDRNELIAYFKINKF